MIFPSHLHVPYDALAVTVVLDDDLLLDTIIIPKGYSVRVTDWGDEFTVSLPSDSPIPNHSDIFHVEKKGPRYAINTYLERQDVAR